jgi:DNA-binding winged helix-turn-helix (wHTH) protein/TolB-like protein/Flp pilus assembly protein TadD
VSTEGQKEIYAFETFRLDSAKRLLFGERGEEIPLMPKAFDILEYLVAHSGEVVEKDDLMSAIWQDRIVEENNLTQNISALRRALGEKHRENRFIATVPGRGYKFVAEVRQLTPQDNERFAGANRNPAYRPWLAGLAAAVLLGIALAAFISFRPGSDTSQEAIRSLAVLPFKPITADSRDEALEMGVADTLILKLGGDRLRVPPIAAVRRFASPEQDPLDAGRRLGVESVLDGGVQIANGRVRVSARLIRVRDGRQMWAGQFDEELRDIFSIQDSISDRVLNALRISLADSGRSRKAYTANVEAYQFYMKGNLHSRRLIRPEVLKGISYYEQAIAFDPHYALPYVELANAYRAMVLTNDANPVEMMPKARAAAMKAVELDDTLAEAWTAVGISDFWYGWDWQAAETNFLKALELDPNSAPAHAFYAHLLSNVGRHQEAVSEVRRARELDPLSLAINAMEGQILFFAGRTDEAAKVLRATMDMDPSFWLAHRFMTRIYLKKGMFADALETAAKAKQITGGNAEAIAIMGYAAAKSGRRDQAQAALKELEDARAKGFVPAYAFALIHLALGDHTKALELLEEAFEQREALMVFLKVDSNWDELRYEPRFAQLMKRMKLD